MEKYLSISEAAKEVSVEGHVLRYWEEELKLSIGRNEQGHRSYSPEDVEQLKQIKNMKEQGLGLKAIKMVMENGRLDVLQEKEGSQELAVDTEKAEKAKQLQWMLRQLIREAVQESNREFAKELRESVVKELDYQFRVLEEQEETREEQRRKREEEHFQKLDELLRKKSKKKRHFI